MHVDTNYIFPEGTENLADCPDIDNLQKFVFNALQTSRLIPDDGDIQSAGHRKVVDHVPSDDTYF